MSSFGWIAAGHRLLLTPWLRRRGVRKPVVRKAVVGLESLESIDLMSHVSPALAHAHLQILHQAKSHPVTEVVKLPAGTTTKVAAPTTKLPSSTIKIEQTITQTTALQTAAVPVTLTNFSQPFTPSIALFNPTLGTLTGVTVSESASLTSNIISENTSTSSGADITGELSGSVVINGIDNPFNGTIQAFTQTMTVPASPDGNTDFTGPSTVTFPPLTGTQSQTLDLTSPADLAAFTATPGHTTITPVLDANAVSQATAPNGNLQTQVMTSGQGTITVSYQYTVTPPTPPQVIKVLRFGIHHQPTTLQVTFSGAVSAADASNPANYLITLPNSAGKFTGPGVTFISISTATYDPATQTATLLAAKKFNFHGQAQLQVTLPSDNGAVFTIPFGGLKSLGGYDNPYTKQFVTYIPGVTVLPM